MQLAQIIGIGLIAGVASGLFGIGGGLIIVPGLVLICGYTLHTAIGTSLGALLLPVGLLGVLQYHKSGYLDLKVALLVALGIFIGTYFGAKIVQPLSPATLKKIYGIFLVFVAVKMFFEK